MNIKEHIEAGHYPTDDKGRALVPMRDGGTATICATDCPTFDGKHCLLGWLNATGLWHGWDKHGASAPEHNTLLPPPPRKVKVTGYARVITGTRCFVNVYEKRLEAAQDLGPRETLVELTGEYEEPWS